MRRIMNLCAIALLLAFFLFGLLGTPISDDMIIMMLSLLIGGAAAIFWFVNHTRSVSYDLWQGWRALRVAYARLHLKRQDKTSSHDVIAALRAGDWKKAACGLQQAARKGDALAHYRLSHLFRRGRGVPRCPEARFHHLKQAAEQGIIAAQAELGTLYANGHYSISSDPWRARDWLEKAAHQGHAHAALKLGALHESGEFGQSRPDLAAHWYRYSAERDNPKGQYHLGRLYLEGKGVKRDAVQASVWLALAAKRLTAESPLASRLTKALHRAHLQLTRSSDIVEAKGLVTAWNQRLHPPHSILTQTRRWAKRTHLSQRAEPILERIHSEIDRLQKDITASLAHKTMMSADGDANAAHAVLSEDRPTETLGAINQNSSQHSETNISTPPALEADWLRNLKESLRDHRHNLIGPDTSSVSSTSNKKVGRKTQPPKDIGELLKRARVTKARLEKKQRNPEKRSLSHRSPNRLARGV